MASAQRAAAYGIFYKTPLIEALWKAPFPFLGCPGGWYLPTKVVKALRWVHPASFLGRLSGLGGAGGRPAHATWELHSKSPGPDWAQGAAKQSILKSFLDL